MAKLETNTIIASSLDNFIIFDNPEYEEMPYVTIGIAQGNVGANISLTFEDADDSDAAKIEIEGKPNGIISARSFNTSGSVTQLMFSLMECLKMNSIVYDIHPATADSLKMGIDTSRRWRITSELTIGGNYSEYVPDGIDKWVLMVNGQIDNSTSQFSLEKYNVGEEISFNITAPFQYITSKFPFQINVAGYAINNNTVRIETITNNHLLVLPTTLDKFESVDYSIYYSDSADNEKRKFLTTIGRKAYNYGEYIGLSILTNRNISNLNLRKKYYTNSGVFLTSIDSVVLKEMHNSRADFYDTFDLLTVENNFNRQVGYVDVVCIDGDTEITDSVRYYVEAKCDTNDTLFFINKIGGLDSFTFNGEHRYSSEIGDRVTFFRNPQRPYAETYELEHVKQSEIQSNYTSVTNLVNSETATWLSELQRSKYVFKYNPDNAVKFKIIIIDDMDIDVSDNEKYYEVECQYHYSDARINV